MWRGKRRGSGLAKSSLFVLIMLVITATMTIIPTSQPAHAASGWSVTYYSKANLTGKRVNTHATQVTANWGTHAPARGIPSNYFSASFSKAIYEYAGFYDLKITTTQGVRVYVDGKNTINHPSKPSTTTTLHKIITLKKGTHRITVHYYKSTGTAKLSLRLDQKTVPRLPIATNQWYGEFYPSQNLTGDPVLVGGSYTKTISDLNDYWGLNAPIAGIPKDHFSAIFQRKIQTNGGPYHLNVNADNGVRVYVDGHLTLDHWRVQKNTYWSKAITLTKGTHTIVVKYFESTGNASLKVELKADAANAPSGSSSSQKTPTTTGGTGSNASSPTGSATGSTGTGGTSGSGAASTGSSTSGSSSSSASGSTATGSSSSTGTTSTGSTAPGSTGSSSPSTGSTSTGTTSTGSTSTGSTATGTTAQRAQPAQRQQAQHHKQAKFHCPPQLGTARIIRPRPSVGHRS